MKTKFSFVAIVLVFCVTVSAEFPHSLKYRALSHPHDGKNLRNLALTLNGEGVHALWNASSGVKLGTLSSNRKKFAQESLETLYRAATAMTDSQGRTMLIWNIGDDDKTEEVRLGWRWRWWNANKVLGKGEISSEKSSCRFGIPKLVRFENDGLLAVWASRSNKSSSFCSRYFDPESGWQEEKLIFRSKEVSVTKGNDWAVAAAGKGQAMLVWSAGGMLHPLGKVVAAIYDKGKWSKYQLLESAKPGGDQVVEGFTTRSVALSISSGKALVSWLGGCELERDEVQGCEAKARAYDFAKREWSKTKILAADLKGMSLKPIVTCNQEICFLVFTQLDPDDNRSYLMSYSFLPGNEKWGEHDLVDKFDSLRWVKQSKRNPLALSADINSKGELILVGTLFSSKQPDWPLYSGFDRAGRKSNWGLWKDVHGKWSEPFRLHNSKIVSTFGEMKVALSEKGDAVVSWCGDYKYKLIDETKYSALFLTPITKSERGEK